MNDRHLGNKDPSTPALYVRFCMTLGFKQWRKDSILQVDQGLSLINEISYIDFCLQASPIVSTSSLNQTPKIPHRGIVHWLGHVLHSTLFSFFYSNSDTSSAKALRLIAVKLLFHSLTLASIKLRLPQTHRQSPQPSFTFRALMLMVELMLTL